MLGVVLSILIVLNLRNGMSLVNIDGVSPDGRDWCAADLLGPRAEPDGSCAGAVWTAHETIGGMIFRINIR